MGFVAKPMHFAGGGFGSLGFASTAGAFISGAAKQENQNLEAEAAQERQDDILQQAYTARADKAIQDYKNTQNTYNSVYKLAGGNAQIADAAMGLLPKNAKPSDVITAINAAGQNTNSDSNYKSTYMQNRRNDVDFTVGRLKPKYRNMLQMPEDQSQNPSQQSQASPFSPPSQQPDKLSAESGNAVPVSSTQPIPLDSTTNNPGVSNDNGQTFNPGASSTPNTQVADNGFKPIQVPGKPMTEYESQQLKLHQHTNNIAQQRFDLDKERKPASPDEAAGIGIQTDDVKKYYHDPKTGLQARYAGLQDLQNQNFDLASMQQLLERGFKSGVTSEFFNNVNRFTNGALGLDLNRDLGMNVANYNDVNLLRKDVANAVIDRLKTLHFGRITNYEAQTVRQGFMSENNDPNTNLKIVLIARSLTAEGMNAIQKEYDTAYPQGVMPGKLSDQSKAVANARQTVRQVQNDFAKQGDAPWPQIKTMDQVSQIPQGQWFEVPDGTMYMRGQDGKLKRAGDNTNG